MIADTGIWIMYELCNLCDHFIDDDGDDDELLIHLDDGEQEYDHDPVHSGMVATLATWRVLTPRLFQEHEDGAIGPNSAFHVSIHRGRKGG